MANKRAQARILAIVRALEQRFGKVTEAKELHSGFSLLDRMMAAVLGTGSTPEAGHAAIRQILKNFVDWNEVRVSHGPAVSDALGRSPNALVQASRAIAFLEALFRSHKSLRLEVLKEAKPLEIRRFVASLNDSDRVLQATLLLVAFDQPVLPPTPTLQRVCTRLGLCRPNATALQCAKKMEDTCSPDVLFGVHATFETLAVKFCHTDGPDCTHCGLRLRCASSKRFARAKKPSKH
jgi:endonuclease III